MGLVNGRAQHRSHVEAAILPGALPGRGDAVVSELSTKVRYASIELIRPEQAGIVVRRQLVQTRPVGTVRTTLMSHPPRGAYNATDVKSSRPIKTATGGVC